MLKSTRLAIVLLTLFVHSVVGASTVIVNPFRCEMSATAEQQLSAGVYLNFSITNLTKQPLKLLTWYTPFEGFLSKLFIIKDNEGKPLTYHGIMVKRLTPTAEDYLVLPPKEKIAITLNLTKAYSLTSGKYSVQLAPKSWQYLQGKSQLTSQCLVHPLNINIR